MVGKTGPRACILDIETTSLDADTGHLIGVGFMELNGRFKWFYVSRPEAESEILKRVLEELSYYHIIFTWNGKGFDLPFLTARAIRLRLPAEKLYSPIHIDLAEFIRNNLRLHRNDLFHVARFFGIRKDLKVEGFDIPSIYLKAIKGDKRAAESIKRHCKNDLDVTRRILRKLLPVIKALNPELII